MGRRLIDANDLIEKYEAKSDDLAAHAPFDEEMELLEWCIAEIEKMPTIEAEPVRHGRETEPLKYKREVDHEPKIREECRMIQDSGNRTEFATGAVRDMHAGKGRMDLLPLTALLELSRHCEEGALKYREHNIDKGIPQHSLCDSAMRHLVRYMRGDRDENHLRAACWNLMWALEQSVNKPCLNDLPWAEADHEKNGAR